jgi:hypothetical protein|tara:strand:- start:2978 stop:3277 length:300 start_codon:yes stop_codon:yes gene_type:complete
MSINVEKLKTGDRIRFGKDSWVGVHNYGVDVSGLTGTIIEKKIFKNDRDALVVQLDEPHFEFEELYDNQIYFDIRMMRDGQEWSFGTPYTVLEDAEIIN